MYWFNTINTLKKIFAVGILISTASFYGCSSSTVNPDSPETSFFDLPKYFEQEIQHLEKDQKKILKSVSKDNKSETQEVQINNWGRELSSFSDLDLNKPAYSGQIKKDSTAQLVSFTVQDPNLHISSVQIKYDTLNNPVQISIRKKVNNLLYTTTETLVYTKNVGYKIEKHQKVLLLGSNNYTIEGKIN